MRQVSLQGKLVLAGGQGSLNGTVILFNDVWASYDGVTWTMLTAAAAWSPR